MRPPRPLPTTMAHQPRFPALVFVFLVVHVPGSRAGPLPPTYDGSMCSGSSRCGGVDIRYPFYLANATGVTTDHATYSCGYTDLRILCQDYGETETAIIQLGQNNYTVKEISYGHEYDAGTIILADADAFRGGGNDGCPIIRHSVTFGRDWLSYTGSYVNLTFFFSCYLGDDEPPAGLGEYRISCPEFRNSPPGGAAFVFSSDEPPRYHELAEHCREIVVVPILGDSLARMSNRSLLRIQYGSLLREGFELAWSRTTAGECHRCEDSGGRCAYYQNRDFMGCLCSDEKVEAQNCSNSGASSTPSRSSKSLRNFSFQTHP